MRWFWSKKEPKQAKPALDKDPNSVAMVQLDSVGTVFAAERILTQAGYAASPVAPPPHLRKGCDLALQVNLVEQAGIMRLLESSGIQVLDFTPLQGEMKKPLDIVKTVTLGDYIMVRAGNMKLTFHAGDGTIVNVSGGGCPDVPYLNRTLVGKNLLTAEPPSNLGFTLCALLLQRAYEEAVKLLREGGTR